MRPGDAGPITRAAVGSDEPASASEALRELWAGFAQFGTDWLYVLAPVVLVVVAAVLLVRRGAAAPVRDRDGLLTGLIVRFGAGAARVTGLPDWSAAGLAIYLAALPLAYLGFLWDVSWHIGIGRDEFLFSPPHVYLLLGLVLIGVAGAVSTLLATRGDDPAVGWRVRRWRIPLGALGLLAAGGLAMAGYWIDEAWHAVYGLDVTMWSPPHLTMISAAAFSPLAGWLLLTEAGRGAARPRVQRHLPPFLGAVTLIALSAWQLEFDLGVPQWQQSFHPVLIALAAGFTLPAARVVVGRGGALLVVAHFVAVRAVGAVITAGAWSLSTPRFPLYVGAAVAVEVAFALGRRRGRSPRATSLLAGVGIATFGMAESAGWMALTSYHPWTSALLWPALPLATLAAIGAAVLGGAYGRVIASRPARLGRGAGLLAGLAVLVAVVAPLPRVAPPVDALIETTPAGDGLVDVAVTLDPPDAALDAERFEVLGWQGGGHEVIRLEPVTDGTDGRYVTPSPAPVGGSWKTLVRLAAGPWQGAAPVALPADPEVAAAEVPLLPERHETFRHQDEWLLREAQDGPAWPAVVGGTLIAVCIAGLLTAVVLGVRTQDRRTTAAVAAPSATTDPTDTAGGAGDRGDARADRRPEIVS